MVIYFAWKNFIRKTSRFVISILGFSLAVIIFVVVLSVLNQADKSIGRVLTHTGTHFIAYKPFCCAPPFSNIASNEGFFANGIPSQPFSRNMLQDIVRLKTVADASPFLLYKINDGDGPIMIGGFNPSNTYSVANTSCSANDIVSGRFLKPRDENSVVLEQSFAVSRSFNINDSVAIKGKSFQIIGMVNPGIRPAKADIYMPLTDAEEVISLSASTSIKNIMNIVLVESADAHVHKQAMVDVHNIIGSAGLLSTYGCFKPASTAMTLQSKTLKLLSIIIFVFVTLLALKTQYTSANEQRRDIGILCSIGWSRFKIATLIFFESIIPACIGGLLGSILAIITLRLLPIASIDAVQNTEHFIIPLSLLIIASCLTIVGGVIAGVLPALSATRRLPVQNLKLI